MAKPTQAEVNNAIIELYKQWMPGATKPARALLPKSGFAAHPARSFNVKNRVNHHFLQHEKQSFGINLGWTDDGRNVTGDKVARWFVARNGAKEGPITFGEPVALGNGGRPSFLRYEERPFGINLEWSD